MSTTETPRRTAKPAIHAYRGNGVNIRFICARCDCQSLMKGSKLKLYRGVRRRLCSACAEGAKPEQVAP